MARLANTASNFCQKIQELYPQKLALINNTQSEQDSPFRRWTTGGSAGSSYRHNEPRTKFSKQMSEGPSSSHQTNSTWRGRVARWSLGLEHLLADLYGLAAFAKFLKGEYAEENIRFWFKCELFTNAPDLQTKARIASQIWTQFLDDGADYPVNVDAAAKTATLLRLCENPLPVDIFQQAQKQIFALLKFDTYVRFLRSTFHAECARADLRGESPPYGVYSLSDDEGQANVPSTSAGTPANSKVKKSASNASDRRRSGGTSLLPWKLRTVSRDRTSVPSTTTQKKTQPAVTDVVKQAGQAISGQSLCRIILPDGATSVVEVDESITVQRVVDRLLQRRNLQCKNYDVMVNEALGMNEERRRIINLQELSTIMAGREAIVERRSVLRVEIGGRCVAVRCRTARRLRHVLRPVLAKYASTTSGSMPHVALRHGCIVHPDTSMQELDGAKLQIVELTENGEFLPPDVHPRESDSLSALALTVQDSKDDDQSATGTSSRCRADRLPPAAGPIGAGATGPNGSGATMPGASGPSGSAVPGFGGNTGGRVRAALRPGPPLHHHPPDFLDNLRDTQRQRLQNKNEPSPAPRTPPPLPPKPSQRSAPTVV